VVTEDPASPSTRAAGRKLEELAVFDMLADDDDNHQQRA
jgi:hypothetical protein